MFVFALFECFFYKLNVKLHFTDERAAGIEGAKEVGPPKFVTQLVSRIEVSEGQSAHFEARLTPTEDPNMKVHFSTNYIFSNKC